MKRLIVALIVLIVLIVNPCTAFANNAKDWTKKGRKLADSNKNEEAIGAYTRAIELDPKYMTPYYNRGHCYLKLRKYQLAIKDFSKAAELEPALDVAYAYRGSAYLMSGKYEEAISDYSKFIKMRPKNNGWAHYNRGVAYNKLGKHEEAMNDWKTAARFGNKQAQDYLNKQGIQW